MSDLNHSLPNGHCVSPKSLTSYQVPHGNSQQPDGAGDAAVNGDDKAFENSAKDLDDKALEDSAKDVDDKAFEDSAKDLKDDKAFEDSAKDLNDGEGFGDVAKDVNDGAPYSDEPLGKGNILVRLGIRSRKISSSQLCIGDHITSDRGKHTYHHHGIFLGNDRVAHFTRTSRSGTKYKCYHGRDTDKLPVSTDNTTELRLTCLKCFMRGHYLYRYDHDRGFSAVLTGVVPDPAQNLTWTKFWNELGIFCEAGNGRDTICFTTIVKLSHTTAKPALSEAHSWRTGC